MYKVNPAKYTGVTVLPSEIAENHLILSSGVKLKVIIYAFHRSSALLDIKEIAKGTGEPEEEIRDALIYWKNLGFILEEDEKVNLEAKEEESPPAIKEKDSSEDISHGDSKKPSRKLPDNNPSKLTYSEITARIGESEDIRLLLNQAQMMLGRTIGMGDQSSLILLHDYFGLPVEVILCICQYAGSVGKSSNMNYIYKIGVDWSHREIDNLEAADEELKTLERLNKEWSAFCREAGIPYSKPTSGQEKYILQWTHEWNFSIPMLAIAYAEMKSKTEKVSYQYMHRILSDWHKKGIKTPEKADEEKAEFLKNKEAKALEKNKGKTVTAKEVSPDPTASYDIKRAEERARASVPKLKKREKR